MILSFIFCVKLYFFEIINSFDFLTFYNPFYGSMMMMMMIKYAKKINDCVTFYPKQVVDFILLLLS